MNARIGIPIVIVSFLVGCGGGEPAGDRPSKRTPKQG